MKRLTEDETQQPNESTSESGESIHHIKEIKAIEEKNKHYTATIKINGVKKEFIIDTGSPIPIMPPDERIMNYAERQKITNRYQDEIKTKWNSGEKIRGKIARKNWSNTRILYPSVVGRRNNSNRRKQTRSRKETDWRPKQARKSVTELARKNQNSSWNEQSGWATRLTKTE